MTATSQNVYFDVLDDIVNLLTLQTILMLNTMKSLIKKILNLKLISMLEFQNTKTFLLKDTLQIGRKKFLLLVKLKIQFRDYVISDLNSEEITGRFYGKESQKTIKEKISIEKILKRKGDKFMSNGKGMIMVLIAGLVKMISYKSESILF